MEILLALALLGLLSAALVSGAMRLINGQPTTPEEIFWQATRAARQAALKSENDVQLSFDPKERTFVVSGPKAPQTFELPAEGELAIDFLQPPTDGGGSVLVGGQLLETRTLPFVTFYADGTCSPFRVQFHANGPAHILSIDPWTCAQVLAPPDPNAP